MKFTSLALLVSKVCLQLHYDLFGLNKVSIVLHKD